jgi:hypothetical protein
MLVLSCPIHGNRESQCGWFSFILNGGVFYASRCVMELAIEVIKLYRDRVYDLGFDSAGALVQLGSEHSQRWDTSAGSMAGPLPANCSTRRRICL